MALRNDGQIPASIPDSQRDLMIGAIRNDLKLRAGYRLTDFETFRPLDELEEAAAVALQKARDRFDNEEAAKLKKDDPLD